MTIGEKIKLLRKSKHLTQKGLGELSKTSETTIKQYELGKRQPRLDQLRAIADALGTTLGNLIGADDVPNDATTEWLNAKILQLPLDELDSLMSDYERTGLNNFKLVSISTLGDALWRSFGPLNKLGKVEAVRRVQELAQLPQYASQWNQALAEIEEDLAKIPDYQKE